MKSSNIGGQAVMEGVMMMNKDRYSVAVRRPDGEIEVKVEQHKPLTKHKGLLKVPILRGVFSFADSMIVGMSSLMYSASFYEDEEEEKKKPATKEEEEQQKAKKEAAAREEAQRRAEENKFTKKLLEAVAQRREDRVKQNKKDTES